jgi:TrmH family RNA methyltransferase
MITSTHNPKIQLARDLLGRPKERRAVGAFVAEGVRLVEEALAATWPFRFVLAGETLSERGRELLEKLIAGNVDVEIVVDNVLQSLSGTETAQGILAVLDLPAPDLGRSTFDFVLIPDQIRDPGNLGTLLQAYRPCSYRRRPQMPLRRKWCEQGWGRTSAYPSRP